MTVHCSAVAASTIDALNANPDALDLVLACDKASQAFIVAARVCNRQIVCEIKSKDLFVFSSSQSVYDRQSERSGLDKSIDKL